jgi:hypothetical protein
VPSHRLGPHPKQRRRRTPKSTVLAETHDLILLHQSPSWSSHRLNIFLIKSNLWSPLVERIDLNSQTTERSPRIVPNPIQSSPFRSNREQSLLRTFKSASKNNSCILLWWFTLLQQSQLSFWLQLLLQPNRPCRRLHQIEMSLDDSPPFQVRLLFSIHL